MKAKEDLISFLNNDVPKLVSSISPENKPLWGAMDAQRVVEHLGLGLKIANGKIKIPASSVEEKAPKLKVISLLSDRPLPRLFTNPILPKDLVPYEYDSLETAKQKLIEEITLFHHYFTQNGDEVLCIHNLFGELNYHEWLWFEYKHFMHHFMQFGVIPIADRII